MLVREQTKRRLTEQITFSPADAIQFTKPAASARQQRLAGEGAARCDTEPHLFSHVLIEPGDTKRTGYIKAKYLDTHKKCINNEEIRMVHYCCGVHTSR